MLKFDVLGCGTAVNPNGYAALLNEAKDLTATITGVSTAPVKGSASLRNVGTGVVAEGHAYLALDDVKEVTVAGCTLDLSATITRTIPKGATTLDLSDLFNSSLSKTAVKKDGVDLETNDSVTNGVIKLENPAAADVKITVTADIATGTATTDNNAAKVNLDAGEYQVHFVARAYDTVAGTNMPNPTMMEFVKHCRPLNIRW